MPDAHTNLSTGVQTRALLVLTATVIVTCPAFAEEAPLFRLFLKDGAVIACQGEYARVGEVVVCSVPLGDATTAHLASIAAGRVDWARTDEYADALRAARYADARGQQDFAALSGEVARQLNEIALTPDNARRLAIATDVRRMLVEWPKAHYNYRATEVQQILQLVDEAISDFRAAAGEKDFDLSFSAMTESAPMPAVLPPPTADESMTAALALAERMQDAGERLTLLEAIARAIERLGERLTYPVRERLHADVGRRLVHERRVESEYMQLMTAAVTGARRRAAAADVRGVEQMIGNVQRGDARLGRQRPERVAAILATLQLELDAARRLRLARDQWTLKSRAFRSYERSVRSSLDTLGLMSRGLDDIKRLAGPAAPALTKLATQATSVSRALGAVVPPSDLAAVHGLVVSAAQLAAQAVSVRQDAIASGAMDRAWQASSAAAGALLLLSRARQDLAHALTPPAL